MVVNPWDDGRIRPFFDFMVRCAGRKDFTVETAIAALRAEISIYGNTYDKELVPLLSLLSVDYWMLAWRRSFDEPENSPRRRSPIRFWDREECGTVAAYFREQFAANVNKEIPYEVARLQACATMVDYAVRIREIEFGKALFITSQRRWFGLVQDCAEDSLLTRSISDRFRLLESTLFNKCQLNRDEIKSEEPVGKGTLANHSDTFPPLLLPDFPSDWITMRMEQA